MRFVNRTPEMSWENLRHLFATWSKTYCRTSPYWKIADRPVCSILNLTDFVDHYGFTTFKLMLLYAKKVMQENLGENPYFIGVVGQTNLRNVSVARGLPIDAVTGYALLPNWMSKPIQYYEELIEQRVEEWYAFQRLLPTPFFPVVCTGWDASVRGERLTGLEPKNGFPWTPIVVGVTPKLFGKFLDRAIEFNLHTHPEENIVFIHAWNEWTESSVVEPSDRFGTQFLEEIRKRVDRINTVGSLNYPPGQRDPN
jgi:hypothetical protein